MSSVIFSIGIAKVLRDTFAFSPDVSPTLKKPRVLKDAIEHAVNQTLLRDLHFGAWATVIVPNLDTWDDNDEYQIRITSPKEDMSQYQETLPKFLAAIENGCKIYSSVEDQLNKQYKFLHPDAPAIQPETPKDQRPYSFLPPFGLSMVRCDSIQLLHYPPSPTLTYVDYLYSATNRRWESLLGFNEFPGFRNTLVETIVDIAPIAADGGKPGGDLIKPVLSDFEPYVQSMLKALLRPSNSGNRTQPLVAYGGPVGQWLYRLYKPEIDAQGIHLVEDTDPDTKEKAKRPDICQSFLIHFFGPEGPATPVFTANHPIKFNYYDKSYSDATKDDSGTGSDAARSRVDAQSALTLLEDLIAAGWQADMAQHWQSDFDPNVALGRQIEIWIAPSEPEFPARFFDIFREQIQEFSLQPMPYVNQPEWMAELKATVVAKL